MGDEGVQVYIHLDEFDEPIRDVATPQKTLTERLERVARAVALNDSIKTAILDTPGLTERLVGLLSSDAPNVSLEGRKHAAKSLEYIALAESAPADFVARGLHIELIRTMAAPSTSLVVKKSIATTLSLLAASDDALAALARAHLVSALHEEQEISMLKRQRVQHALERFCARLSEPHREGVLDELPDDERRLVAEYAARDAVEAARPLASIRATILENGFHLYLHTAAGGAAWGLFESLRERAPRAKLVENVARTAFITCFVPILAVGGVVTTYSYLNRKSDSVRDKFVLYSVSALCLYPGRFFFQWVERFAPLWLGGHVVGFSSFLIYTMWSESDLLKSDAQLEHSMKR